MADIPQWIRLGVDLLFCTNNIVCLRSGAQLSLEAAQQAISATKNPTQAANTSAR
jgi:hypothetical protein